ncbi:MAG: protein kinase [Vulcanimicrobiota bacterium]
MRYGGMPLTSLKRRLVRAMFREGQTLKQTYRVERKLSGSKTAFKVRHLALKVPLVLELVVDESGLEELPHEERRERQAEFLERRKRLEQMAALAHPALARIVDIYESESSFFVVREWVEGYTLRELVARSLSPLDQATAQNIAEQLLSLLDTLQEHGLVLGTLCPDYIVMTPDGVLKVLDYGVSAHSPGKTEFEPFSSPEIMGGGELDLRAELYALAAVLYFAVTGAELPPIWDRITQRRAIPTPLELEVKVDGRFWAALEKMLQLAVDERPQSLEETRALFAAGEFVESPESSPATWYPEQDRLMLGAASPFMPMAKPDWILKMVQAAVVGKARGLAVRQGRESCALDFRFAAPDVPAPRAILSALSTDQPIENPAVAEIAAGLRVIGEFRSFCLTLDDWKQSWSVSCEGGRLQSRSGPSQGRSGMYLEVRYEGKARERAAQAADELVRLVRKTRLCEVPITIDKKPLEPGRNVDITDLPKDVVELYLVSASLPLKGGYKLVAAPEKTNKREALTTFAPRGDKLTRSHVDVRCYISPGENELERATKFGYHFLRRPSRILWYRRGVLCGEKFLEKKLSLQLDIHINGDGLECDPSGLKLKLPDFVSLNRLRPIKELEQIVSFAERKMTEFWEENPTEAAPKSKTVVGMLGAPLLLIFFSGMAAPGLIFLKNTALAALMKAASLAGGVLGFATSDDHLLAVRKACLKAISSFKVDELA